MVIKKEVKKNSIGDNLENSSPILSYFFGVVGIVTAFFSPLGLEGIIFSVLGLYFSKKKDNILSRKGRVLSIIGLVVGVVIFVASIISIIHSSSIFRLH